MDTKVITIEQEVSLIKSFVIGLAGKDREGNYRPEFVKRVLEALSDRSRYSFTNATGFLACIRNKK